MTQYELISDLYVRARQIASDLLFPFSCPPIVLSYRAQNDDILLIFFFSAVNPLYICQIRPFFFFASRYFTGHTTNSDGTVQFVKRHTSVKSAIFGSIKILTVAVCSGCF